MPAVDIVLLLLPPALFFGIVGAHLLGRRMGMAHAARNPEPEKSGTGAVEGALFALLGLLVAFTFSGAAERFDARRRLIVEEANAVSTAYLRLDLLPAAAQPRLRDEFRRYVAARIRYYRSLGQPAVAAQLESEVTALQRAIWKQAVGAAEQTQKPAPMMQITTALNAMIDITTTRAMALLMHPPATIYVLLVALALICGLLAGFGTARAARPSPFHVYGFAAVVALTVALTIDLEFPRYGLIRVDAADQLLIAALNGMQSN